MTAAKSVTAAFTTTQSSGTSWYVDNAATGANNGTSWQNAWRSPANVVWGASGVKAGDTLYISGGSTSKTYLADRNNFLNVGASGTAHSRITIRVGQEVGHNGQVIFDAGGVYSGLIRAADYVTVDGEVNGQRRLKLYNINLNDNYCAMDASSVDPIIRYV